MQPAADNLSAKLASTNFIDAQVPVVANVHAKPVTSGEELRGLLVKQVVSPVQWEDTIKYLISEGVDTFVEIGSGTVLAGLIKKIDKTVQVISINSAESATAVAQ